MPTSPRRDCLIVLQSTGILSVGARTAKLILPSKNEDGSWVTVGPKEVPQRVLWGKSMDYTKDSKTKFKQPTI